MNFDIISSSEDWAALQDEWQQLFANSIKKVPFLEYDYQRTWWETLGGGEWPISTSSLYIITARQEGQLVGIAPLFLSSKQGAELALRFIGQIEVSDYLDFLCCEDSLGEFITGLLHFIATSPHVPVRELALANFTDDSPSLPYLETSAENMDWDFYSEVLQPSPYIPVADTWEGYLNSLSKKQRHEIRRKLRNAEERYETTWFIASDPALLDEKMNDLVAMMRKDPEKDAFLNSRMVRFMKTMAEKALASNQLHLSFLTFDGVKVAAYLSLISGGKLWVYNSAWDYDYAKSSPGWVLLAKVINWAIEAGLTEVDMMRGDEVYKYRFGGLDRHVLQVMMGPNRFDS